VFLGYSEALQNFEDPLSNAVVRPRTKDLRY